MENYKLIKEELEKTIETFMLSTKWRELPQGIYYIRDAKPTKYGYQLFLTHYQEEYFVWSPSKMNEELDKNVENHFVRNNGIRITHCFHDRGCSTVHFFNIKHKSHSCLNEQVLALLLL